MLNSLTKIALFLIAFLTSSFCFSIEVYRYAPSQSVNIEEGQSITFSIGADDPYGLTFCEWYVGSTFQENSSMSGFYDEDTWTYTFNQEGTYDIFAYAYNVSDESDFVWWSVTVSSSGCPDLTVKELSTVPENPVVGEEVDLHVEVENIGNSNYTETVTLSYYLDLSYVDYDQFSNDLNPGESEDEVEYGVVFSSPGNYLYSVIIDENQAECSTTNNSGQMTITVEEPVTIGTLELTQTPTGLYEAGTEINVGFTSTGQFDEVLLQFTEDEFEWSTISNYDSISGNQTFSETWALPMVESENCKIRVVGFLDDQTVEAVSDDFSVSLFQRNKIFFAGYDWRVTSYGDPDIQIGAGNNYWSNSENSVFVDEDGDLNLTIRKLDGKWRCSEVVLNQEVGYGEFKIKTRTNFEAFNQHVVSGFFTYKGNNCITDCFTRCEEEIDIEFSYWNGEATGDKIGSFVFQDRIPENGSSCDGKNGYTWATNRVAKKDFSFEESSMNQDLSTHQFIWTSNEISFKSHYSHDNSPNESQIIHMGSYSESSPGSGTIENNSDEIPLVLNTDEEFIINFWLYQLDQEAIQDLNDVFDEDETLYLKISDFEFIPYDYTLKILSQLNNQEYASGSSLAIDLNVDGDIENISIAYSTDFNLQTGEANWIEMGNIENGDDSFLWNISEDLNSSTCKLRLSAEYEGQPVHVYSEGFFAVNPNSTSLDLTYPVGGETFYSSDSVLVEWESQGIFESFIVDFTIDGGGFYEFVDEVSGSQNNLWVVIPPGVETSQARVRIIGNFFLGQSIVAESQNVTILDANGAICGIQKSLNHQSFSLGQIQSHLLNQGVPSTIVSNVNPNYFYKISLRGGGGVNTRTEMALCLYDVVPEICIVRGTSDASDLFRTSINTVNNFSESFGFNGQGWTDVTTYAQSSFLYLAMDSKWGSNIDTYIDMYIGTNEIIEILGAEFIDTNSDDFGGGSVNAVDVVNTSSISTSSFEESIEESFVEETYLGSQIRKETFHNLTLKPNPVKSLLNVSCESCGEVASMNIINAHGKTVFSIRYPNLPMEIDVQSLSPGVYILEMILKSENAPVRKKFIRVN